MQAKLAAQKLAERLNIKMTSFEPEGEAAMQYREVRDEDDFSADDWIQEGVSENEPRNWSLCNTS